MQTKTSVPTEPDPEAIAALLRRALEGSPTLAEMAKQAQALLENARALGYESVYLVPEGEPRDPELIFRIERAA